MAMPITAWSRKAPPMFGAMRMTIPNSTPVRIPSRMLSTM